MKRFKISNDLNHQTLEIQMTPQAEKMFPIEHDVSALDDYQILCEIENDLTNFPALNNQNIQPVVINVPPAN